jgi:hypothetical protein
LAGTVIGGATIVTRIDSSQTSDTGDRNAEKRPNFRHNLPVTQK